MRSAELPLKQYDSDKVDHRYLETYDPVLEPWVHKEITLLELGVHKGGSLLLWRDYFPHGTIAGIDIKLPDGFPQTDRIHLFQGSQADKQLLSRVAGQLAPAGFDIIIDDASHLGELTEIAFWHLFDNHLKPGGLYVIEDWGTGYWDDWPDGKSLDKPEAKPQTGPSRLVHFLIHAARVLKKVPGLRRCVTFFQGPAGRVLGMKKPWPCHSYGMVGFVKQLVDEQAAVAVTSRTVAGKPARASKFASMQITSSIVFIHKASAP